MESIWTSFWTWFVGGLASGALLTQFIEFGLSRWAQTSDRVRLRKDAIGQEFNKIYLEGKSHGFTEAPRDYNHISKIILDIEKYDKPLSKKLARCRYCWMTSAMFKRMHRRKRMRMLREERVDQRKPQLKSLKDDDVFDRYIKRSMEASRLAEEVYVEIRDKWII